MNLERLAEPFPAQDIEWRIGRAGSNEKGIWATCLAYVTNRAIMDRLDLVCGPENWKNEFREWMGNSVLCGISIKIDGEWVTKWDGSEQTDIESIKGGLSGAMKRAAVQWGGIGRYLYDLPEGFALIKAEGRHRGSYKDKATGKDVYFKWDEPDLPLWAIPGGTKITTRVKDDVYRLSVEALAASDEIGLKQVWNDFDVDEKGVLWSLFNSSQRSSMKLLMAIKSDG